MAQALRPVGLGRRLEWAEERDLAAHGDLDVGPSGELEDGARVDPDLFASILPETHVTATMSASGEAAAYSSARLSSMPVSTSRMRGRGVGTRRC